MTDLRIPPSFIQPETIKQLSEEDQLKLVEAIRERRMIAVTQLLLIREEKAKVKGQVYEAKFDRLIKKISKHVEKIDAELEKLGHEFTKLRILRLEAFDV